MLPQDILSEYRAFARRIRLRAFFGEDPVVPVDINLAFSGIFPYQFRSSNSSWNPLNPSLMLEDIIKVGESIVSQKMAGVSFSASPMLPSRLLKALKSLQRDPSIIIKPADKNLGLVVLDKSWYVNEGKRQLGDHNVYCLVEEVPWQVMQIELQAILSRYSFFLKNVERFLLKNPISQARPCAFYLLPKIHKPTLVGRPICSYSGYFLEPVSKFLHFMLLPILLAQPNHLADSLSLLQDLRSLSFPRDCFLFSFDVESLYPSIPTALGLTALKEMLSLYFAEHKLNLSLIPLIMRLAELVLHYHFLEFDGLIYKQIRGTAMGSNFAVVYACLFLCHLESKLSSIVDLSPLLFYRRYIDDAVGVWGGSEDSLHQYLSAYASYYPKINITSVISSTSIVLLDIHFFKGSNFDATGILSSQCFQKELNAYQYIPFSSWHPLHQKCSFIISEIRRFLLRESNLAGFVRLKKMLYFRLRALTQECFFIIASLRFLQRTKLRFFTRCLHLR
ncbi:uncharacterized protein LOC131856286 [Cryptomeria japonica]|uniref:uncharacterized protein LOC131856286 n=1 Tax=Cryptomeria japonica TaxID=3369 RepID=UPI0027DA1564|nr:uncharacterized protein LOC131856286 [Cryptomeria japonica]